MVINRTIFGKSGPWTVHVLNRSCKAIGACVHTARTYWSLRLFPCEQSPVQERGFRTMWSSSLQWLYAIFFCKPFPPYSLPFLLQDWHYRLPDCYRYFWAYPFLFIYFFFTFFLHCLTFWLHVYCLSCRDLVASTDDECVYPFPICCLCLPIQTFFSCVCATSF